MSGLLKTCKKNFRETIQLNLPIVDNDIPVWCYHVAILDRQISDPHTHTNELSQSHLGGGQFKDI